jgi:hypothetical protein
MKKLHILFLINPTKLINGYDKQSKANKNNNKTNPPIDAQKLS